MLSFLKSHPFAVETFFERSLVLTYAVPKEMLQSLIPSALSLDTYQDQWGFVALAMVQTRQLRPRGFPAFMGSDFILTGYRVFVRYQTSAGKRLRGLYILRSETNSARMSFFGNIFTHYNYTTTDIRFDASGTECHVHSTKSALDVRVACHGEGTQLPQGSPFADWKEARRFAGPLPFTFTWNNAKKEMLIIEGVRENWTPKPMTVLHQQSGYIDQLGLPQKTLANAFMIENVPYYWKKGKTDPWQG